MSTDGKRRVVCAAIRHRTSGDIILGPRHFDLTMHAQIENYKLIFEEWNKAEQGFIDTWGTFLTREEALQRAIECEQLGPHNPKKCYPPHKLFSEDLY